MFLPYSNQFVKNVNQTETQEVNSRLFLHENFPTKNTSARKDSGTDVGPTIFRQKHWMKV